MSSILAIGNATAYDISNGNIIAISDSLQTSGLDLALTMDEVRGGRGNSLRGFLPHSTGFGLTMEDSLFKFEYMALNCGGDITASADVMTVVTLTTTVENQITAPSTPVAMAGETTVYGWYKLPTSESWTTITFTGSVATVSGLASGTEICLKYMHNNASARQFTIGGAFLPKIVRLEVTWSLYATSDSATGGQSLIGELQFEIPKFQFAGAQSYSVSASGTTTSPLSGNALITSTGSCTGSGYYALVKEVIYDRGAFDNVKAIMIEGSVDGFDIAVAGTETLNVYAVYNDGTSPSKLDNSLFTFTSSSGSVATVGSHTGVVVGAGAGSCVITCVATDKTSLETNCSFTVA